MEYELAKQLKDAGFPQEPILGDLVLHDGKIYIHTGGGHLDQNNKTEGLYIEKGATCCFDDPDLPNPFKNIYTEDLMRIPTFEELIEACGDIIRLQSYYDHNDVMWQADNSGNFYIKDQKEMVAEVGSTPTEAVARLWIAFSGSH